MRLRHKPVLWKTAECLRTLGYDERSIREITAVSRREILRHHALHGFRLLDQRDRSSDGSGGAPVML